jgi:alkanesulfonate monooxygenase SsuD/methylene tetrahydromethanopterin reductase-like flavin-dependent oxidoreductase (luciferase family)
MRLIHAGPQDCSIDDLRRLWRIADERGFHWCSVWDHLYSVSDLANPAKPAFEGVATMAALATQTTRVRVGCLVFCVAYRPVGVLAKGAVDDRPPERRRCELGIGAGWNEIECASASRLAIGARLDWRSRALPLRASPASA